MKNIYFVAISLCFFHNYFSQFKNKVKLPKQFLFIPFEIEPYEFENYILRLQLH